jgi:hypothetical protein
MESCTICRARWTPLLTRPRATRSCTSTTRPMPRRLACGLTTSWTVPSCNAYWICSTRSATRISSYT